jgi:hypothetical protein
MEDLRPEKQKQEEYTGAGSEPKKLGFFKRWFLILLYWSKKYKKRIKQVLLIVTILFVLMQPKAVGGFFGKWYKNITESFIENSK